MMKVLIGTPVHESKDYAMERWFDSVSKFDYPFDLFIVDNSPGLEYVKKINGYCKKYGITNYKLIHINVEPDTILDERLARSRELIRQNVLTNGYDAWFSLECDIIAPPDTLSRLVNLIGDYWMASHIYPSRNNSHQINEQLGITLIKRSALEKYSFINGYGYVDFNRPDCWYGSDVWFVRQIDTSEAGKHINIGGIIKPIYHLAQ